MTISFFDIDKSPDPESKDYVDSRIKELFEIEPSGKYGVVLHNDPVNGIDFVTRVIKSVFGYPTRKAIWLMLKAHFSGSSLLWSGSYSQALGKRNEILSFGPDPAMVDKGAEALKVSVELQA
jgi:ATP-dependent Clp protease adapter protein ClpS